MRLRPLPLGWELGAARVSEVEHQMSSRPVGGGSDLTRGRRRRAPLAILMRDFAKRTKVEGRRSKRAS